MDTRSAIREFVRNNLLKGSNITSLEDSSSFIEAGVIDSLGVLELTAYIEETFGFRVEDEELVPENLDSVDRIVDYVTSKLAGVQARAISGD